MNYLVAIVFIFFGIFLILFTVLTLSDSQTPHYQNTSITVGSNWNETEMHAWTKAIYDGTSIQDFLIKCNGKELVNLTPIGEEVYVGRNWTDPRNDSLKNKWC